MRADSALSWQRNVVGNAAVAFVSCTRAHSHLAAVASQVMPEMSVKLHVTLPQLAIFSTKLTTGHPGKLANLKSKLKILKVTLHESFNTFPRCEGEREGGKGRYAYTDIQTETETEAGSVSESESGSVKVTHCLPK